MLKHRRKLLRLKNSVIWNYHKNKKPSKNTHQQELSQHKKIKILPLKNDLIKILLTKA
jgi:hypothetical protein